MSIIIKGRQEKVEKEGELKKSCKKTEISNYGSFFAL